jgi:hypothetical protein
LKTGVNLTPCASEETDEGCFATQPNSTGKKQDKCKKWRHS